MDFGNITTNIIKNRDFISNFHQGHIFNTQHTNELLFFALGYEFKGIPYVNQNHLLHSSGEIVDYEKISDVFTRSNNEK